MGQRGRAITISYIRINHDPSNIPIDAPACPRAPSRDTRQSRIPRPSHRDWKPSGVWANASGAGKLAPSLDLRARAEGIGLDCSSAGCLRVLEVAVRTRRCWPGLAARAPLARVDGRR
jgi:hypothetical protein